MLIQTTFKQLYPTAQIPTIEITDKPLAHLFTGEKKAVYQLPNGVVIVDSKNAVYKELNG
jgi:hypothetical protein